MPDDFNKNKTDLGGDEPIEINIDNAVQQTEPDSSEGLAGASSLRFEWDGNIGGIEQNMEADVSADDGRWIRFHVCDRAASRRAARDGQPLSDLFAGVCERHDGGASLRVVRRARAEESDPVRGRHDRVVCGGLDVHRSVQIVCARREPAGLADAVPRRPVARVYGVDPRLGDLAAAGPETVRQSCACIDRRGVV